MALGPVNQPQTQRTTRVEPKMDAAETKPDASPTGEPALAKPADLNTQNGAREQNLGMENEQKLIQEVRRRGGCGGGRGRCASLTPSRGLGGNQEPETMLA